MASKADNPGRRGGPRGGRGEPRRGPKGEPRRVPQGERHGEVGASADRPRRIVYLPLDERPCNLIFPQLQLPRSSGAELVVPPRSLLGYKKTPADREAVLQWLEHELVTADYAVLSIEMLLYGGLLASRIHTETTATILERVEEFSALLRRTEEERHPGVSGGSGGTGAAAAGARPHAHTGPRPHAQPGARPNAQPGAHPGRGGRFGAPAGSIDISLFGLIMRTPSYSSDEEEPEYYRDYGREIFYRGYLGHKAEHEALGPHEQNLLAETDCIPELIVRDYDARRRANLEALKAIAELLVAGRVNRLVLPEDDTATYGYGPREKASLLAHLEGLGVADRVLSYPGADEVGMTLTARAALDGRANPKVHVVYSHDGAEAVIPRYESQPLAESVAAHVRAAGGEVCSDPEEADVVLGVAAVPGHEGEAWGQDATSPRLRDGKEERRGAYNSFAARLRALAEAAPTARIALADCVYSNGADRLLVESVAEAGLWPSVIAFAAWNTAGNTIGTAVSRGHLESSFPDANTRRRNLVYRLLDDWAYQSYARTRARRAVAEGEDASRRAPGSPRASYAAGQDEGQPDHGVSGAGVPEAVAAQVERDMAALWQAVFGEQPGQRASGADAAAGAAPGPAPAPGPASRPTPADVHLPDKPGIRRVGFPWDRLFEIEIDLAE